MVSDVPVGAFLSGGVDSSLLVAYMSELSARRVKTFSIGFSEEEGNEFKYSRWISHRFQTDHHEYLLSENEFLDSLPKIIWYQDEPLRHHASVPLYFLSKFAKDEATVILSGEGFDAPRPAEIRELDRGLLEGEDRDRRQQTLSHGVGDRRRDPRNQDVPELHDDGLDTLTGERSARLPQHLASHYVSHGLPEQDRNDCSEAALEFEEHTGRPVVARGARPAGILVQLGRPHLDRATRQLGEGQGRLARAHARHVRRKSFWFSSRSCTQMRHFCGWRFEAPQLID